MTPGLWQATCGIQYSSRVIEGYSSLWLLNVFLLIIQLIGLREQVQEHPIIHGKIYGFRLRLSLSRQPIESFLAKNRRDPTACIESIVPTI